MCQDRNAVPDENVSEVKSVIVTINSIKNQKSLRSTDAIGSGITFRHHHYGRRRIEDGLMKTIVKCEKFPAKVLLNNDSTSSIFVTNNCIVLKQINCVLLLSSLVTEQHST